MFDMKVIYDILDFAVTRYNLNDKCSFLVQELNGTVSQAKHINVNK